MVGDGAAVDVAAGAGGGGAVEGVAEPASRGLGGEGDPLAVGGFLELGWGAGGGAFFVETAVGVVLYDVQVRRLMTSSWAGVKVVSKGRTRPAAGWR